MTNRIKLLEPLLANQIAAGEVVERPQSIVKELVENSIDAQATSIDVDIIAGGVGLIRVRDNGLGISKQDLPLCFARHATSKITSVDDLHNILSLGFRGEALASIAAVTKCRISSRPAEQEQAYQCSIGPDLKPDLKPIAHPIGTTIEVADLFVNTPVRRKFLKSEKTEFLHIDETLKRLALSHPHISFKLNHGDKSLRNYPAVNCKDLYKDRISRVCGKKFISQALVVDFEAIGLKIKGYIGTAESAQPRADNQYFFVNNRIIKDKLINHAIKSVYNQQQIIAEGLYPSYVLYFEIAPSQVDVNVHPTKHEVRFLEARHVHDFIEQAVSLAFSGVTSIPNKIVEQDFKLSVPKAAYSNSISVSGSKAARQYEKLYNPRQQFDLPPVSSKTIDANIDVNKEFYRVAELEDSLIIVDCNRAKRQILMEYLLNFADDLETKQLLFPEVVELKSPVLTTVTNYIKQLEKFKFNFNIHDDGQVVLCKHPQIIATDKVKSIFDNLDDDVLDNIVQVVDVKAINKISLSVFNQVIASLYENDSKGPWIHFNFDQLKLMIQEN